MSISASTRASWGASALALACLVLGIALAHRVEPGVRVESVTVAGHTPALRFLPAVPGQGFRVLLAHGVTASKETMFRFGEALAAAGFTCLAVDLPGHGESTRPFDPGENAHALEEAARAMDSVEVFVGHSMGAYAGAESVRNGRLKPALFVAVGARPRLGESGPSLLLLEGRFEEAISPGSLGTGGNVRLVVSPCSDHALEPYDPRLVDAAVEAACAVQGMSPPPSPGCWRWRLVGLALAVLGALVLGDRLPALFPGLARVRGPLIAVLVILAVASSAGTWLGAAPVPRRLPMQGIAMALSWLAVVGAGKMGIPRWAFGGAAATGTVGCLVGGSPFLALLSGLFAMLCFAGAGVGWLAARGATPGHGDMAFAVFTGYAMGQWMPLII